MLRILRTDIRRKLKSTKMLLISGTLIEKALQSDVSPQFCKRVCESLDKITGLGVRVIIYTRDTDFSVPAELNAEILDMNDCQVSEKFSSNGNSPGYDSAICMGYTSDDLPVIRSTVFSFTPASASLVAKMVSSYSSHNDCAESIVELADIISSAKAYTGSYD